MIVNSVEMARLLQRILRVIAGAPLDKQAVEDLERVAARLERTCTERGCPTCGSSFYTFEERSEP